MASPSSSFARKTLTLAGAGLLSLAGSAVAQSAPPFKPNFPVVINESPPNQVAPVGSKPLIADLGLTPGFKSIVYGLRNGDLYVLQRMANGTWGTASGWPQQLPAHIYSSPAAGDLNNDGVPEIVVGYGSTFVEGSAHGGVRAYRRNGTLLWEVLTGNVTGGPGNTFRDPVMSTPAIGDIDGDGTVEVVFGGLDHTLYVVNGENGLPSAGGWPLDVRDTIFSSPALHDMDGDGRRDIVIGSDSHEEGIPNTIDGGLLHVLRFDRTYVPGFPKEIDQVVSSSPAVGDIDGDGRPEIVHGTGTFWPNRAQRVYAWNCDGTPVAGWPVAIQGQAVASPALANLDGDAPLEVVITAASTSFRLYAFNGNGSQVFTPPIVRDFGGNSLSAGEPVIADVLGDTALEILVPTNGEVAIFSLAGAQLTETDGFPDDPDRPSLLTQQEDLSGVVVTDLETDGAGSRIEVVAVGGQPFPDQTQTVVYAWNPVDRTSTPPWGSFRQNDQRTGVVPGTPSCAGAIACSVSTAASRFFTVFPCRVVDTRNAGQGPALLSGASRLIAVGGACGVPANAKSVSLNITVTQPTSLGHVTLAPAGCAVPGASTINFGPGQTRANNAVLPLSGGALSANAFVLGGGSVHLIVDVNGYFQ